MGNDTARENTAFRVAWNSFLWYNESMTEIQTETPVDEGTLADALELIRVATTLGMKVPAPVGTVAFYARLTLVDGAGGVYTADQGTFGSKAAALRSIANWVLEEWYGSDMGPWLDGPYATDVFYTREGETAEETETRALEEWLAAHTDQEILDTYFGNGEDFYEIVELTIEATPDLG